MDAAEVTKMLKAALEHEPRVNLHRDPIRIEFSDGVVTLSGDVADIAAKRLTLEYAAALPAVVGVVDRLRVRPAEPMGDGEIADHVLRALTQEPVFDQCAARRQVGEAAEVVRPAGPERDRWWIECRVEGGVVTLDGDVPSLSHKRLAGAMAWWVPGSREVINGLGVEPAEADNDGEILDALRLVLEKDPLIDATQIRASCMNSVISLDGIVGDEADRDLAEFDAWALFGVDKVINRIDVQRG
jgi:osmotically-inducible protein OsmY